MAVYYEHLTQPNAGSGLAPGSYGDGGYLPIHNP